MPVPSGRSARGNRSWLRFTHSGTYDDMLFFQLPNHSSTSFTSWARACSMRPSTSEKSNSPSCGSMSSQ